MAGWAGRGRGSFESWIILSDWPVSRRCWWRGRGGRASRRTRWEPEIWNWPSTPRTATPDRTDPSSNQQSVEIHPSELIPSSSNSNLLACQVVIDSIIKLMISFPSSVIELHLNPIQTKNENLSWMKRITTKQKLEKIGKNWKKLEKLEKLEKFGKWNGMGKIGKIGKDWKNWKNWKNWKIGKLEKFGKIRKIGTTGKIEKLENLEILEILEILVKMETSEKMGKMKWNW